MFTINSSVRWACVVTFLHSSLHATPSALSNLNKSGALISLMAVRFFLPLFPSFALFRLILLNYALLTAAIFSPPASFTGSSSFFEQFRWDTTRRRIPFSRISLGKHRGRCPVVSLGHAAPGIRRRLASRRPLPSPLSPCALTGQPSFYISLFPWTNQLNRRIGNVSATRATALLRDCSSR